MHYSPDSPSPLSAVIALVLSDESLQRRLGAIEVSDAFVAAVLELSVAHAIVLDPEAVRQAIRPDPLGISRWMPSPVTLDRWPTCGWLPAYSVPTGGVPALDWAWFGSERLADPFFVETVQRVASRPLSLMLRTRTSLEALAGDDATRGPEPAGFIYHMSRCGSTLVAQTLAADPANIVLSEPEPFDGVLRWAVESGAPLDEQIRAVRTVAAALGRDRSGTTRRVFFKLDSWLTAALPLLRAAFPDTPWVFVYRDPIEVLVSQANARGIHTVAGALPISLFAIPDAERLPADEHAAHMLVRASEAVLDHWRLGGGLLVDYREMPDAIVDRIAPHFGFVPDPVEAAAMRAAATRNAKVPTKTFIPDTAGKRAAATPELWDAARLVAPVHARLAALRRDSMMRDVAVTQR
ncbi:hypothetical protein [Sphingomonas faeni]|uniref:hypothetical protein n=1 Tax=Sphingomonas faeni TaxID=185950 RepID=UPI00335EEB28